MIRMNKQALKHKSILLVLLLALEWNATGTSLPQERSAAKFKISTDLVLVDVSVSDKKGSPIRGLSAKDFHVFEDGVEQSIQVFQFEDVSKVEAEMKKAPAAPTPLPAPVAPAAPVAAPAPSSSIKTDAAEYSNRRLIVMMFDLTSLDVPDAIYARKSAEEYIRTKISPADLVAVVVMSSSLRVVQDFTDDPKQLLAALNRIKLGQSADLADMGQTDPTANDNTGTVENTNEDTSDSYVVDDTQFNIFNTDRKLVAIESIAKMLKDLPERKSLIHFSSGLQTTGIENEAQLRATVDAANRANMSIYAVDARGLIATPLGGDASHGGAGGSAMFSGASQRSGLDNIAAAQETLTTLSEDTGGRAFLDTNDLTGVFTQVQDDTQSYYIVGYYSSNAKHDGHFRKIKVMVDAPGAQLRFRQGYFAPKEFGQFTKDEREHQLQEVLNDDTPFTDLPFILAAYSFKASDPAKPNDNQMFVPVSLRLPSSDVPFIDKKKAKEAEFDFVGEVLDPAHNDTMISYIKDAIHVKLDETTYARVSAGGTIQYDTGFYLRPGAYKMKFIMREDQSGKMGSFEQNITVPDLTKQPLQMSSVVLSSQLAPADKDTGVVRRNDRDTLLQDQNRIPNPLVMEGKKIVPNVGHVFSPAQTLYTFFQVYNPAVDHATKKPHVDVAMLFFKSGKLIYQTPEYEVDKFNNTAPNTVDCNFSLPLTQLKAGRYTLQLVVSDHVAGNHAYKRLPFIVR